MGRTQWTKMSPEERQAPRFHKACRQITPRDDRGSCLPCMQAKLQRDMEVPRFHERCGEETLRDAKGRCIPCRREGPRQEPLRPKTLEEKMKARFHDRCGKITPRYKDGTCIPCSRERNAQWEKDHPDRSHPGKWCDNCQEETERNLRGNCIACRTRRAPTYTRRRRTQKLENGIEPYSEFDIFVRNQWICHLCGDPIDPAASRMSSEGATIDHLVPLSKGGADTAENVAPAHRQCNLRRHNKPLDDPSIRNNSPIETSLPSTAA